MEKKKTPLSVQVLLFAGCFFFLSFCFCVVFVQPPRPHSKRPTEPERKQSRKNSWPGFKVSLEKGMPPTLKCLLRCFGTQSDKAALICGAGFRSRCSPNSSFCPRFDSGIVTSEVICTTIAAAAVSLPSSGPRAATQFKYVAAGAARKTENFS